MANKSGQDKPVSDAAQKESKDIEDNKIYAALSYLGLLVLIPLLVAKDSKYAQFHAKQGLVFLIIFFVGSLVFWIPLIGWLAWLFFVVIDIYALVQALSGNCWKAPVVGDLAEKLKF